MVLSFSFPLRAPRRVVAASKEILFLTPQVCPWLGEAIQRVQSQETCFLFFSPWVTRHSYLILGERALTCTLGPSKVRSLSIESVIADATLKERATNRVSENTLYSRTGLRWDLNLGALGTFQLFHWILSHHKSPCSDGRTLCKPAYPLRTSPVLPPDAYGDTPRPFF